METGLGVVAYVDVGPFILFLVVIGVLGVLGIVALPWVTANRGRPWMMIIPLSLAFVAVQSITTNNVSLVAAWLTPLAVAISVFYPARHGSRYKTGVGRSKTNILGFFALLAAFVLVLVVNGGMNSNTVLVASSSFTVTLSPDNPVEIRAVTISAEDLPATSRLGDLQVSANTDARIDRRPEDDEQCGTCDAHYLVSVILTDPMIQDDFHVEVQLKSRVRIRHRDLGNIDPDQITFSVDETDNQHLLVPVEARFTAELTDEIPSQIVRVSASIPAEAMQSDSLNEWPAYWVVRDSIRYGEADPDAYRGYGVDLRNCVANKACETVSIRQLELQGRTAPIDVTFTLDGAIAYLAEPFPDPTTSVELAIDAPRSWHEIAIRGDADRSPEAESLHIRQTIALDGIDQAATPVVIVEVTEASEWGPATRLERPRGCEPAACVVSFTVRDDWAAVVRIGFFSDEVPEFSAVLHEPEITEIIDIDSDH